MWARGVEANKTFIESRDVPSTCEDSVGSVERMARVTGGLVVSQSNAFCSLDPEGVGAFDDEVAEGGAWGELVRSDSTGFNPVGPVSVFGVRVGGGVMSRVFLQHRQGGRVDPDRMSGSDSAASW
jgi:hypothetical protein